MRALSKSNVFASSSSSSSKLALEQGRQLDVTRIADYEVTEFGNLLQYKFQSKITL